MVDIDHTELGVFKEKVIRNEKDIKNIGENIQLLHDRISNNKTDLSDDIDSLKSEFRGMLDSHFKWVVGLGFSMLATIIVGAAIVIWTFIKYHAGIVDV